MSFLHKPSGLTFENRKQCVKVMGYNRYCRALANKEFQFRFSNEEDVK